jgi:hypothetical protein
MASGVNVYNLRCSSPITHVSVLHRQTANGRRRQQHVEVVEIS